MRLLAKARGGSVCVRAFSVCVSFKTFVRPEAVPSQCGEFKHARNVFSDVNRWTN